MLLVLSDYALSLLNCVCHVISIMMMGTAVVTVLSPLLLLLLVTLSGHLANGKGFVNNTLYILREGLRKFP